MTVTLSIPLTLLFQNLASLLASVVWKKVAFVTTVRAIVHAGSVVLVVHQVALSCGLIGVVHAEARGPALWHLNKEGVLSLPGYWALSLLSVGLSSHLHPECASPHLTRAKLADR